MYSYMKDIVYIFFMDLLVEYSLLCSCSLSGIVMWYTRSLRSLVFFFYGNV